MRAPSPEPVAVSPLTAAVAVPEDEFDEAPCEDVAPDGGAGGVVTVELTVYETGALVELAKPLPAVGRKTAVRESVPTGSAVVAREAAPPLTDLRVPDGRVPIALELDRARNGARGVPDDSGLSVTEVPESCGLAGVGVSSMTVVAFKGCTV